MTEGPRGGQGDHVRRVISSFGSGRPAGDRSQATDESYVIGRSPRKDQAAKRSIVAARDKASGDPRKPSTKGEQKGISKEGIQAGNSTAGEGDQPKDTGVEKEENVFPLVDESEVSPPRTTWGQGDGGGKKPPITEDWDDPESDESKNSGENKEKQSDQRIVRPLDEDAIVHGSKIAFAQLSSIIAEVESRYANVPVSFMNYRDPETGKSIKTDLEIERNRNGTFTLRYTGGIGGLGNGDIILDTVQDFDHEKQTIWSAFPNGALILHVGIHTDAAMYDKAKEYTEKGLWSKNTFSTLYYFLPDGSYRKLSCVPPKLAEGREVVKSEFGDYVGYWSDIHENDFEVVGAALGKINEWLDKNEEDKTQADEELPNV